MKRKIMIYSLSLCINSLQVNVAVAVQLCSFSS